MPKNLNNYHPRPCANCGHTDMHGEVAGCIGMTSISPDRWCDCTAYVAPQAEVGRTVPSRRTDPGTSHQAAAHVVIRAGNQRTRLLAAWAELEDATDEEAMEKAEGVSALSEYAKRSSELRDGGYIVPTGDARTGQSGTPRLVSKITDAGRAALAAL